jgi:serine/threonine-protein kinase
VAGDTTGQACTAIVNAHFVCGSNTPTASNLSVGSVVSTSPAAGSFQPLGTTINLNVSSGPSTVVVQNVVGETQANAEQTLTGQGLTPVTACQVNPDPTQNGIVAAQTPSGGTPANPGAMVTITVDSDTTCPTTTTAA